MKKAAKILTIFIFIAVLLLPLFKFDFKGGGLLAGELRYAAKPPVLAEREEGLNSFLRDVEAYINDNVGFRNEAITANTALRWSVFGKLAEPHFIVGKSNNLFYVPADANDPFSLPPYKQLTEEEASRSADHVYNYYKYFSDEGVPFLAVFIPNKENVYPELWPDTFFVKPAAQGRLSLVSEELQKRGVNALDLTQALIAGKDEASSDLLYGITHNVEHWKANGAHIGYEEIMKYVSSEFPDIKVLEKSDYEITVNDTSRQMFAGNFKYKNLKDTVVKYEIKNRYGIFLARMDPGEVTSRITAGEDAASLPITEPDIAETGFNSIFYYYKNDSPATSRKLLVIGDSYLYDELLDDFAESFSDVMLVQEGSYESIITLSAKFKPDYVIYEDVERDYAQH